MRGYVHKGSLCSQRVISMRGNIHEWMCTKSLCGPVARASDS